MIVNWKETFASGDYVEYTHKNGNLFIVVRDLPPDEWVADLWQYIEDGSGEKSKPIYVIENAPTFDDALKQAKIWMRENPDPVLREEK